MATNKPTKPSITLPSAFGTSSSNVKTEFTAQELIDGYSASIPQILDGGNLNYMIDALFQFLTYSNAFADWFNSGTPNTVPYINSSNQLDYESPVFGNANNTFSGTNTFNGAVTFSSSISLGSYATATTPATSSNNTSVATTEFIGNKFQVVNSLPSTPDTNVWYFIKET